MLHRNDYTSLFLSCFDVSVRLGSLFQWIASVYDRIYLPRLGKFFEEDQIFRLFFQGPYIYGYAGCQ